MLRWTRWALWTSCAFALLLALWTYAVSPDVVPVHFDRNGRPDRWGAPLELLIVYGTASGLGTLLFTLLPELLRRAPPQLLNLPNKGYWLSPEHRALAVNKFTVWSATVGTALNALFVTLQLLLAPKANTGPAGTAPLAVVVSFLLFTICSCIWLIASYRLPRDAH